MVIVAQLVRALDCESRGRGFEFPLSPTRLFCTLNKKYGDYSSVGDVNRRALGCGSRGRGFDAHFSPKK